MSIQSYRGGPPKAESRAAGAFSKITDFLSMVTPFFTRLLFWRTSDGLKPSALEEIIGNPSRVTVADCDRVPVDWDGCPPSSAAVTTGSVLLDSVAIVAVLLRRRRLKKPFLVGCDSRTASIFGIVGTQKAIVKKSGCGLSMEQAQRV